MKKFLVFCIAILAFNIGIAGEDPHKCKEYVVHPIISSIDTLSSTFIVHFGYTWIFPNKEVNEQFIPVGKDNLIKLKSHKDEDLHQIQPTTFYPGKHDNLFKIEVDRGSSIEWKIGNEKVKVKVKKSKLLTGVIDDSPISLSYSLKQNYPNPFNPQTIIKFELIESGNISLDVYNIMGQKVQNLIKGTKNIGISEIVWNPSNLPNGIYFAVLDFESSHKSIIKMQYLK